MLLTGYSKKISLPACMPGSTSLHCVADLNEDISAVIPYINATIGGYGFVREPTGEQKSALTDYLADFVFEE